jgi:hypothetical protein
MIKLREGEGKLRGGDMCGVREGVGLSVGRWFENNIRRKVSDEKNTSF